MFINLLVLYTGTSFFPLPAQTSRRLQVKCTRSAKGLATPMQGDCTTMTVT